MPKFSPEQWSNVEERVEEAEKAERKSHKASRELHEKTETTKTERVKTGYEAKTRVERKALEREKVFEKEAEEILGADDSPERALAGLQKKNLIAALRNERKIENAREKLIDEEVEILKDVEGEPTGSALDALDEVREELAKLEKERGELLSSSPEAYFGLHLKELKSYKEDLGKGKIAETPYVKRQIEDVASHLRANKPVLVYGQLGAGKTELAMHVARSYIGKEALVISGSKHTSLAELYGHQMLSLEKIGRENIDEYTREVAQKYDAWVLESESKLSKLKPEERESEKNRAHDRILQTYLTQFKGGTISDFFMGPIYRAMEEGRPVIIDEVNAIPHEVLISLNHILTRKVGDEINVQQDTGRSVTVKEGFGIIMTGNLNQGQERYIDRQDMDPAFLSRLHKIEYDYLPQKTEGGLEEEAGPENELFHLLLAKVMDRSGNIEAPRDTFGKLWNLAKAARITQDVFSGKEVASAFYMQEGAGRAVPYMLKESVMSIRALEGILAQWQKEGYKRELDYYLWKEFISQSTVASDRAYLYQLLKDRFGFFKGAEWEQQPSYGSGGVINTFKIQAPDNKAEAAEFFGPRDTVRAAFGAPPERAKWPEAEVQGDKEEEMPLEALASLEEFKSMLDEEMSNLEKEVEDVCEIGEKNTTPPPRTPVKSKRGARVFRK